VKALVIEDNRIIARQLKRILSKGTIVDVASSASEALSLTGTLEYDIILLDLGLPDMPGMQLCKQLRSDGITAPIIVITGYDNIDAKIQLLNTGADDYMTKPFHAEELLARIAALMRRHPREYHNAIQLKVRDVVIDVASRQVFRAGVRIELRRKEFDILEYLVLNKGRAVSRQMILCHVWENDAENQPNTIDVHIKTLRDKIERPFSGTLIKTAYGIGYMVDDIAYNKTPERTTV
jgi:DNA-binding response OmpR family regulator